MIVNCVIPMMVSKEDFQKLAASIVNNWAKRIPNERHVNDRILVFGTVGGHVMQQVVIVTPETERSTQELIDKYLKGDYSSPEKEMSISELIGC